MQRVSEYEFNPAIIRQDAGFCYVIALSNGVVKAGRTNDLFSRYESHRVDAKNRGISIEAIAFTSQHESYKDTESRILERFIDVCESRMRKEYFTGVNFDDAARELCRYSDETTIANAIIKSGKDNRSKLVSLRVSDDDLEALEAAAASERLKLGTWIKQAAMKAADRQNTPKTTDEQQEQAEITPQSSP